jgi:hypothetical protein
VNPQVARDLHRVSIVEAMHTPEQWEGGRQRAQVSINPLPTQWGELRVSRLITEPDRLALESMNQLLRSQEAVGWLMGEAAARVRGIAHEPQSNGYHALINTENASAVRQANLDPKTLKPIVMYHGASVERNGSLIVPVQHKENGDDVTYRRDARTPGLHIPDVPTLFAIEARPSISVAHGSGVDQDWSLLGDILRGVNGPGGRRENATKQTMLDLFARNSQRLETPDLPPDPFRENTNRLER